MENKEYTYSPPDVSYTVTSTTPFYPPCNTAYDWAQNTCLSKYNSASFGGAKVYIKYGKGHTKLVKPIIMVEGIDFNSDKVTDPITGEVVRYGTNGWENVVQGLSESKPVELEGGVIARELFRNYPKLIENLTEDEIEAFDLVLIDFIDGADYIQKNGEVVIEVINMVNQLKECGEENVVVGLSMGGQVARWALTTMEKRGIDHDTRTFISYDSPHLGANIPLAIQGFIWFNANYGAPETREQIEKKWHDINKPAAAQMLLTHFYKEWQEGKISVKVEDVITVQPYSTNDITPISQISSNVDFSCLRESYIEEMENLGYPKLTYNIAIANGFGTGQTPSFGPGDCIISADNANKLYPIPFQFIPNILHIDLFASPGNANNQLLKVLVPKSSSLPLELISCEIKTTSSFDYPSFDAMPGCQRNDVAASIHPELKKVKLYNLFGHEQKLFDIPCFHSSTTFMPTYSVIGYKTNDPFENIQDKYDINFNISPFDELHMPLGGNEAHVDANIDNITFMEGQKDINAPDQPHILPMPFSGGDTYNFGLFYKKMPKCDIFQNGTIWINKESSTSYINAIEPKRKANSRKNNFEATLAPVGCNIEDVEVNIFSGGTMNIGTPNNSIVKRGTLNVAKQTFLNNVAGNINIHPYSNIVVHNEGQMKLGNGSLTRIGNKGSIVVKSGGTLIIESGATLVIKEDGQLIVEKGGQLIINDGSEIILEKAMTSSTSNEGSVINLEGRLFLPDGRLLLKGSGFLIFGKDHSIKSGAGFVKLESLDDDHVAYRVDKEINMNLYDLSIINAKFYLNDHIKFFTKSFLISGSTLQSVVGQVTAITTTYTNIVVPSGGGNFIASNIVTSRIENSVLDDVSIIVDGVSGGGKPTLFLDYVTSVTKRRANNFELSNIPVVSLSDCNISTQAPNFIPFGTVLNLGKVGLQLVNVGSFKVANSIIEKFILANGVVDKSPDKIPFSGINCVNSYNVYLIENTLIDNCYHGVVSKVGINVLMDKATISNCDFGIKMFGDASTGLVKMLCSALLENKIGIYGYGVTLAIDGIINQQNTTFIPQNRFEVSIGNNIHFSISYSKKNVTNIFARKNYWINPQKYSLKKSISGQNITLDQSMPGDGVCGGKNFTHCTASPPIFPITQSGIPADVYAGFCANSYTCSGFPIMQNYWKGYNCLYNGEYESAIAYFIPLAEQSYESSGYSQYCQDMMNEARAWVGGYQSYQGQYELLKFDSLACLLKWGTPYTLALYELQKKNGSTWTTVPSAVNPYPIDGYNFGDYRLKITKNNCPVFITEEVHAECDTICIDLLSANWYLDTLISLQTQLSQATNYSIKIDLRLYDPADPVVHTMTFPIVGNTSGVNINIIDPFNQYPLNFGYHALWTVYIECNDCNEDCTNDTAIIMLPPVRLNNYIQNKQALLSSSKESQLLSAKIYPNPSSDNVIIESDNGSYDIEISDINGKLLKVIPFDGSKTIIDNSDLNSGIYLLKIRGNENKLLLYQSKIVKIE